MYMYIYIHVCIFEHAYTVTDEYTLYMYIKYTCTESPYSSSCAISQCVRVQCSSSVGGYLGEIGDICWVERLANMVASHMLAICPTPFERGHLLKLLNDGTFGQGFQCSGESWFPIQQYFSILWRAATCNKQW